jgi:hypothetical protein
MLFQERERCENMMTTNAYRCMTSKGPDHSKIPAAFGARDLVPDFAVLGTV